MNLENMYESGSFFERIDSLLLEEPCVYLKCPLCRNVYLKPVINIKCGHSFCESCISKEAKPGNENVRCPIDGKECRLKSLVINRAIQDQINNLLVKCKFSDQVNGCADVFRCGELNEHEKTCAFALVECPNKPKVCFKIQRKDVKEHLIKCQYNLTLPSSAGDETMQLETFRQKFVKSTSTEEQLQILKTTLENMINKVCEMSERLKIIENNVLQPFPESKESDYESIEEFVERKASLRLHSVFKTSEEFWVMPFQFKCIGTMRCHGSTVTSIAVLNRVVFSTDMEGNVKIWNLDALEKGSLKSLTAGKKRINAAVVHKECLYTAGDDLIIKCWGSILLNEISSAPNAHEKSITALVCSADKLFSASFTNVKVWQCKTLEYLHIIRGLHHWARSLATNSSNDKIYVGAHGTISIWKNSSAFESVGKIIEPIGSVYSLAVTKLFIIAGTYNKNIHIYDADTLLNVHHFTGHVGIINYVVSPPVKKFLISCSSDSTILLWCLDKMLPIQAIQRHDASVTCAAIAGDVLLTGSEDTEIKIFRQFKSA